MTPFDLSQIDRLLMTTRAVRYRLDLERPVDRDVVMSCIRLANYAPSRSNTQPFRWVVVDDPEQRRLVGECYRDVVTPGLESMLARELARGDEARTTRAALYLAEHMPEVPVLVVPCYDLDAIADHYRGVRDDYDPSDRYALATLSSIYPAVWGFQLACRSRLLGTTLTTAHLRKRETVAGILGLPSSWEQTSLIPVAHVKGGDLLPARRQPVEDVVFWNRYAGIGSRQD
jgi:nitroreductase